MVSRPAEQSTDVIFLPDTCDRDLPSLFPKSSLALVSLKKMLIYGFVLELPLLKPPFLLITDLAPPEK